MRQVRSPRMEIGEARIEDIELNLKSRDDIPALPAGLQHLYGDPCLRSRLFALLEEHIAPGRDRNTGRPGMEMWRILVMGVASRVWAVTSTCSMSWSTNTGHCACCWAIRAFCTITSTTSRRSSATWSC